MNLLVPTPTEAVRPSVRWPSSARNQATSLPNRAGSSQSCPPAARFTALADDNIESRPLWKPMHLQPVFRHLDAYVNGNSERLFANGVWANRDRGPAISHAGRPGPGARIE